MPRFWRGEPVSDAPKSRPDEDGRLRRARRQEMETGIARYGPPTGASAEEGPVRRVVWGRRLTTTGYPIRSASHFFRNLLRDKP